LSINYAVLLEIHNGSKCFYAAIVHLDYNDSNENIFKNLEEIIEFTEGTKLIIAMDSNSRSTTWHEVLTNSRGKLLEEFIACNQLYIINEERTMMNFQSIRGSSNENLTIVNKHSSRH